ncbi:MULTISPECIES: MFS transporter [Mameliella]|uniref:MFS transporter n=1 Tax=Mameliella TaxID=1434019 RepID=UPI000B53407F|nr:MULTISPECIES: MFS transporter [Mameliella]MCR9272975.1 MFS transporter [Paracoccaceae bacterium]OWV57511.1 arabinose ABC transporter permease [Mameliella alba]
MTSPWAALAVLFTARLAMAFQYQVVGSLGPMLMERHGTDLADLGILISLYLLPGLVFALPGGGIAQRLGDRRVVAGGLVVMVLGGLIMWQGQSWSHQILGRLLAGTGGVLLNVIMTKMVADWFAGRNLATAMGIFVNSWPAGIALALLVLPLIAQAGGLNTALATSMAFCIGGLVLMTVVYRDPPAPLAGSAPTGRWPRNGALTGIVIAGCVWGLYNGALAMVFAFGPALLVERGVALTVASGTSSLVLWLAVLSVPAGGLIGDRIGRPNAVLLVGLAGFAATFALALAAPSLPVFILMGLACGLPAGPIMALPGRVLQPESRALGMGIFFTLYYFWMAVMPALSGALSEQVGSAAAAFWLGILLLALAALGTLGLMRSSARIE